ncbi:unnamed protein product [Calicophoron daubneyi]|uniref:MICOS complex subunit n=1 Tax=Calicophoron daubneyi TaxID=300641 RepID=A0AAV2TL80_CALDB
MKVKELSLYSEYPDEHTKYTLEPRPLNTVESHLVGYISPFRRVVQDWLSSAKVSTEESVVKVSSTSASLFERLKNEPSILARGGFITVCGLGGVVLGYRGGAFRKLFYATCAASLATTACYPSATYAYCRKGLTASCEQLQTWKKELSRKN